MLALFCRKRLTLFRSLEKLCLDWWRHPLVVYVVTVDSRIGLRFRAHGGRATAAENRDAQADTPGPRGACSLRTRLISAPAMDVRPRLDAAASAGENDRLIYPAGDRTGVADRLF